MNGYQLPVIIAFVILVAIAIRVISEKATKNQKKIHKGRDDSTLDTSEKKSRKYSPISKQNNLLFQQKIVASPSILTPDKMTLPNPLPTNQSQIKDGVEQLFLDAGFYPTREHHQHYFVGCFGEFFFVSLIDPPGIGIFYADDFERIQADDTLLFGTYPMVEGEEHVLQSIYRDLKEYAEVVEKEK